MSTLTKIPTAQADRCAEENNAMENRILMSMLRKTSDFSLCRAFKGAGQTIVAAGLITLAGCSSSSTAVKPQIGPIAFTDVNATTGLKPLSSLTVGQGTYLDVTLASDPKFLGADWTAVCGSALPPGTPLPPGQTQDQSCGTFTPGHTMGAPLPSYATNATGYVTFYTAPAVPPKQGIVTLYASATSDPTQFTSVTITINGLPISVGFAPAPPNALGLNTSTQFKAVLTNDATNAGVNWSVLCGSSACGSFSSSQTASGVVTTYTSPSAVPIGGTVKLTATSIADPTKSTSATVQIMPVGISVTPTVFSVATAGTEPLIATVVNDGLNKGVDWTVSCTNAVTPASCGTITAHTASGVTATYTAPSLANIAVGTTVTVTAASTADPTQTAMSVATMVKGNLVSGVAQAGQGPLRNAQIALYAAATKESLANTSAHHGTFITTATTDQNGNFAIPYGYECPTPDTPMYLVSSGGNAGGGTNPNLALMAALGSCATLDASRFTINEATTVASVYALSAFITDAHHIGSSATPLPAMTTAFATANDLVDVTTGSARPRTASGAGVSPQAKIDTLANAVSACARTAGPTQADGSACDLLFRATNPGSTPVTRPDDTVQALLSLARHATGLAASADLYQLAASSPSYTPVLAARPADWTLSVEFPRTPQSYAAGVSVDSAGNLWLRGADDTSVEYVGAASSAGMLKSLTSTPSIPTNIP
jgi:hypothetical protein